MSDSRNPDGHDLMKTALDLEEALSGISAHADAVSKYITKEEYNTLTATGVGKFLRSFTGPKVTPEDQRALNLLKVELHSPGTDQKRYEKAKDQLDAINKDSHASGALREYASKLDSLIKAADTRALDLQNQQRSKK